MDQSEPGLRALANQEVAPIHNSVNFTKQSFAILLYCNNVIHVVKTVKNEKGRAQHRKHEKVDLPNSFDFQYEKEEKQRNHDEQKIIPKNEPINEPQAEPRTEPKNEPKIEPRDKPRNEPANERIEPVDYSNTKLTLDDISPSDVAGYPILNPHKIGNWEHRPVFPRVGSPGHDGPGEGGYVPVELDDEEKRKVKGSLALWGFNMVASNKVSLDRIPADLRMDECKHWDYPEKLPAVSGRFYQLFY